MNKRTIPGVRDAILPFEPRVRDRGRQQALTERYLLPALPELHAFFLAVRLHLDVTLQAAQPARRGKPYPLGQCLEISMAALRLLQHGDVAAVAMDAMATAGHEAFTAFRKAGGELRPVWGDLRGEFFQNAFQLGTLYLDVSNDTVVRTKPKVEILPFEQANLAPVADYRHFVRIASRYWKHQIYPNHVLPELAPYCPLVHVTPEGHVMVMESTEYMVGMVQAGHFAPSEAVLSDPAMPDDLFRRIVQVLHIEGVKGKLPRSAEEGRTMALQACREYRRKRWHATPSYGINAAKTVLEINRRLARATAAEPYIVQAEPPAASSTPTIPTSPPPSANDRPAMNTPEKITIDGVEYRYADLSDEARRNIDMVRAIDMKIADLQRDVEINQAARSSFIAALLKSLPAARK